jgi:hypothetical protein
LCEPWQKENKRIIGVLTGFENESRKNTNVFPSILCFWSCIFLPLVFHGSGKTSKNLDVDVKCWDATEFLHQLGFVSISSATLFLRKKTKKNIQLSAAIL